MTEGQFQPTPEMEAALNQRMEDLGWSLHGQGSFDEILAEAWPLLTAELRRLIEVARTTPEAFYESNWDDASDPFPDWLCGPSPDGGE